MFLRVLFPFSNTLKNRQRLLLSVVWFSLSFHVFVLVSSKPLAVACGSSGGKDEDGRNWEPDQKFLKTSGSTTQLQADYQDPSLLTIIPYMNARIFTSPATYRFPIKSKEQYLVRFHFYPSAYPNFNISNSFFSVTAGGLTLMNNFSAEITCKALTQAYLVREYSLAPSDSEFLNVTFTPSTKYTNSFAFVNGIELISMPNLFGETTVVGYDSSDLDVSSENFQTMFRLNVGGQFIPPSNDSGGLLRSWYNDDPYIFGSANGIHTEANKHVRINYEQLSRSSAPEDVYRTAREMGLDCDLNLKFNLTWLFQVDANFTYIVRLHFCEFKYDMANQRVFNIYINNQSAQSDPTPADIFAWTGGMGIPTYRDYAISVNDGTGDEMIRIQMSPSTESKPQYYDSLLNGIEIFKLNDENKNLAGSNPQPSSMLLEAGNEPPKSFEPKSNHSFVIAGAAGGVAAAFVVVALAFLAYRERKRGGFDSHTSSWLPLGNSHATKSNSSNASALVQGLSRRFSISEIRQATRNFDDSNVIGVGGFGKVYKGVIEGGTKVAVKRSNPSSEQGINEFETEVGMLSKLRHKHLVSLIGFCEDGGEMCLVYDYMALGTFREHLYNNKKPHLSWKQRLEICIGAARGLHYLHTGAKYTIIHRDVKTTNILLDEKWVAKVSDFGLSKTGPGMSQGHISTMVKGSFGYLDPEYFRRQQLTEKSDVYSFGVVLFEALCARPVLNPSLPKEQVSLADWALLCHKNGTLEDISDPHLKGKIDQACLQKFTDTAVKCLSDQGIERPNMGDVLWNLEFALQLQESSDTAGGSIERDTPASRDSDERSQRQGNSSQGSDIELNEELNNQDDIFSQLFHPQGR
ncbi:Receptor-like protein kinase FERONIA [Hibiscus syriacus]|uniref:non-specific serine/threonine protein kinase n=1 Tax=Hibiscus syriacus TaxID=106335 RepID=A0A6A2YXC6_HIBSY|nr:receptor-like protein kinase ANXUR1 [Hibiscus syriacus]KAE8684191.1 Receptor-like protein kinase FERONIA [Hibiscus syriacus]